MLKNHLVSIRHDFQQNKTLKCKKWVSRSKCGNVSEIEATKKRSVMSSADHEHPKEVKTPNVTAEECLLQSFSGIINISKWTVEYSEFKACLLSDLISYRRPRCKMLNQVSRKLWKPACLVLCSNNLCVTQRKKATINGVQTQLWKFQVPERTAVHASFIPLAPEPKNCSRLSQYQNHFGACRSCHVVLVLLHSVIWHRRAVLDQFMGKI